MSRTDNTRPWRLRLDDPTDPLGRDYHAWKSLSPPPRWFRAATYHRPARHGARRVLAQARAEYRAVGDTDLAPAPEQHRHRGQWLWW